jgi:hypothetical protein
MTCIAYSSDCGGNNNSSPTDSSSLPLAAWRPNLLWPCVRNYFLPTGNLTAPGLKRRSTSEICWSVRCEATTTSFLAITCGLDTHLAALYGVEASALNRGVKRNRDRFAPDFMFQAAPEEVQNLRFQIGISSPSYGHPLPLRSYPPAHGTPASAAQTRNRLPRRRRPRPLPYQQVTKGLNTGWGFRLWTPDFGLFFALTGPSPTATFPADSRGLGGSLAGASPDPPRSTSDRQSEVLRGGSGEAPARPARGTGAVSEGIAGGLMIVLWQPHHKGFSASHWHPGTSVADVSRRLDCAKSLLGFQIRIPGSDWVRSPRVSGEAPMNIRSYDDYCRRYHRGPRGVPQEWTVLPRTTRNAVLHATGFVARNGPMVLDTAWLHLESGCGLD